MDINDARWFALDTEDDGKGHVAQVALLSETGEHWVWKKPEPFIKWLDKLHEPVVICAHNLKYDLGNVFGVEGMCMMQLNWLRTKLISAKYGKYAHFRDSAHHFRMSLASLGGKIGIEKLKMDIHSKEYVLTDCRICLTAMIRARDFIASIGGKMGATAGSSAVSVWRHMTDDEWMIGPIDNDFYRQGYYGGRSEIFRRLAEGDIHGYDVNSMYPYCMLGEFPETLHPDPTLIKGKGMAEVTIKIPTDMFVSPLVSRNEHGRLTYMVGIVRGTWTYDEIRFAEQCGAKVLKVHNAVGSHSLVRPFRDFILSLYDHRKRAKDDSESLFLKVLMNSLYGKLASRNVVTRMVNRWQLMRTAPDRIPLVRWITPHFGLLDFQRPQDAFVNVVWGAMITANSRILLTKYLMEAKPESLIYCDTDSIYTLGGDLPTSNELGHLKLEKTAKRMFVPQLKVYQLDDFYRAKGVPSRGPQSVSDDPENILSINPAKDYIEKGRCTFMQPIGFRQIPTRKGVTLNEWTVIVKNCYGKYDRKLYHDGRYFPPVAGCQVMLTSDRKSAKSGRATIQNTTE